LVHSSSSLSGAYAGDPRALFDAMMRIDTLSGPRDIPGLLCSAPA
jgi:hypothetical protein